MEANEEVKTAVTETEEAAKEPEKKTVKKKAADKAAAVEIEAKKTVRKAERKVKEAGQAAAKAVKKTTEKAKAAKLEIVIQSPLGGNITPEEIAAKLPKGTEAVYVRVDHNKLWWVKGNETGSVDIW